MEVKRQSIRERIASLQLNHVTNPQPPRRTTSLSPSPASPPTEDAGVNGYYYNPHPRNQQHPQHDVGRTQSATTTPTANPRLSLLADSARSQGFSFKSIDEQNGEDERAAWGWVPQPQALPSPLEPQRPSRPTSLQFAPQPTYQGHQNYIDSSYLQNGNPTTPQAKPKPPRPPPPKFSSTPQPQPPSNVPPRPYSSPPPAQPQPKPQVQPKPQLQPKPQVQPMPQPQPQYVPPSQPRPRTPPPAYSNPPPVYPYPPPAYSKTTPANSKTRPGHTITVPSMRGMASKFDNFMVRTFEPSEKNRRPTIIRPEKKKEPAQFPTRNGHVVVAAPILAPTPIAPVPMSAPVLVPAPVLAPMTSLSLTGTGSCYECIDYSLADYQGSKFPRQIVSNIPALAQNLTSQLSTPVLKARAIFTWLHHNIAYDTVRFFAGTVRHKSPEETLRTGLAVCQGYAELFEQLGRHAGLEVMVISGHGKGFGHVTPSPDVPVPSFNSNHAWNAVKLDGMWKPIDPCWGAGHTDESRQYVKAFDPKHFTGSPEIFRLRHYPTQPEHQYCSNFMSWEEYILMERPLTYGGFDETGLNEAELFPNTKRILSGQRTRFVVKSRCPHKPIPLEERYVLLLTVGRNHTPLQMEVEGSVWSVSMPPLERGKVHLNYLNQLGERGGKGITPKEFEASRNRLGMGWTFMAEWEVV